MAANSERELGTHHVFCYDTGSPANDDGLLRICVGPRFIPVGGLFRSDNSIQHRNRTPTTPNGGRNCFSCAGLELTISLSLCRGYRASVYCYFLTRCKLWSAIFFRWNFFALNELYTYTVWACASDCTYILLWLREASLFSCLIEPMFTCACSCLCFCSLMRGFAYANPELSPTIVRHNFTKCWKSGRLHQSRVW